ncbi:hypothetical protein [Nocardiopsis quinghaiensis]|uniref:hypothetical protein n=1 Tax=Nocardiopsis quinghaiensis TaxID=464995 RepID=UPI00123C6089|nr:hypothetical protein [Nocardiopsis quinghaiensis]
MSSRTILEAMQRGTGIGDPDAYKRGNAEMFKGIDAERAAIKKRARALEAEGVTNADQVARKEFSDADAKRRTEQRERTLRTAMDAIQERDSREARAKYWEGRADEPLVPPGEIPPGTPVNVVHRAKTRDRVGEKLMAQAYRVKNQEN